MASWCIYLHIKIIRCTFVVPIRSNLFRNRELQRSKDRIPKMHTPVCTASVLWMSTGAGYFIYLSDLPLGRQTFLSEYEQGRHHQPTEEPPSHLSDIPPTRYGKLKYPPKDMQILPTVKDRALSGSMQGIQSPKLSRGRAQEVGKVDNNARAKKRRRMGGCILLRPQS